MITFTDYMMNEARRMKYTKLNDKQKKVYDSIMAKIGKKLTKSEQELIALASRSRMPDRSWGVEKFSGQGRKGGRISGGQRLYNAALSLEQKGIVTTRNKDTSVHSDRGYGTTHYTMKFALNPQYMPDEE